MSEMIRKVGAELLIGVAVCVAASELLLTPKLKALQAERAAAETARAAAASDSTLTREQIESRLAIARVDRESIERASGYAKDESALYAAVMDAAKASGVRVEQFAPAQLVRPGADPSQITTPGDNAAAYTVQIVGDFGSVVSFGERLRELPMFLRVASARLNREAHSAEGLMRADMAIEVFGFSTASAAPPATGSAMP